MKDTINRKLILLLGAAVTALICLMLVLDLTLAGTVKPMDNSLKGKPQRETDKGGGK